MSNHAVATHGDEDEVEEGAGLANGLLDTLHPDTLAALMLFLPNGRFEADEEENEEGVLQPSATETEKISEKTVCVAYTAKDVNVIAETLKRLELQHAEQNAKLQLLAESRVLLPLQATAKEGSTAYDTLMANGIVRLDGVLSLDLCDALLVSINAKLAKDVLEENPWSCESGYGNVLCRENRWDQYLRCEGLYLQAHQELFSNGSNGSNLPSSQWVASPLSHLFDQLFDGAPPQDIDVHEYSALIADKGANTQPIHPDTMLTNEFTVVAPLYTVFIALQDIDIDMGATIFLPRTNTQECHDQHKHASTKDVFLSQQEYRQSTLKKGDCAVMDSRLLHCGDANNSKRRVLMYITLRNPHCFESCVPPIPRGSKWHDLAFSLALAN